MRLSESDTESALTIIRVLRTSAVKLAVLIFVTATLASCLVFDRWHTEKLLSGGKRQNAPSVSRKRRRRNKNLVGYSRLPLRGGDDDPDLDAFSNNQALGSKKEDEDNSWTDNPRGQQQQRRQQTRSLRPREENVKIETCVQRGARIWKKVKRRVDKDSERNKRTKLDVQTYKLIREAKLRQKLSRPVFKYRPDLNMRVEVDNPYTLET
mmetsp:Transcript_6259/g.10383  ORF Transcript_6259/g.10383 Transcript_6259/m.10383 type:complete len:209 (-) Transcript_6259:183-809(-)